MIHNFIVSFLMKYIRSDSKRVGLYGSRSFCLLLAPSCEALTLSRSRLVKHACPIAYSGLSATVGAPEKFNTWLEAVQKAGGFQHTFIHYPHRYSHLRKYFYNIHEKPSSTFESISTCKSTGRMRYLHPIAMLTFGPRSTPSDLALEALDTLTLYRALAAHGDVPSSTLDTLDPLKFFPSDRLLQQKDVIAYDVALKACLAPMVAQFDPRNTAAPLYKVIASLEDGTLSRVPTEVINTQPERGAFRENLIHLVCDLHAQGDLVSCTCSGCAYIVEFLNHLSPTPARDLFQLRSHRLRDHGGHPPRRVTR